MEELNNEQQTKRKNVFTNKNFTLTFLGALVSNVASLFYSFAVSFYILKITDNNALLQGLYLAAGGVTFCIVTLFGGVISDRFNKAKIMYICDYLKGAIIIGFTFLLMFVIKTTTGQVVALFIVSILLNAIAGIFTPLLVTINVPSTTVMMRIIDKDKFGKVSSVLNIGSQGLIPLSVLLGGVAITYIGSLGLISVCAGGFLLISLILFFNKPVREL